jgi:hypothetical protein
MHLRLDILEKWDRLMLRAMMGHHAHHDHMDDHVHHDST